MDAKIDPSIDRSLRELTLTRVFDAPRALVWAAWTEPEHLAGWWGPHGFDAPHPAVDLAAGVMNLDMRAPDRSLLPNRGIGEEVVPMEKLVVVTRAFEDEDWRGRLEVRTTVTLAEEGRQDAADACMRGRSPARRRRCGRRLPEHAPGLEREPRQAR